MKYVLTKEEYRDLVNYRDRYLEFVSNKDNNVICVHSYYNDGLRLVTDIKIHKKDLVLWLCSEIGDKEVRKFLKDIKKRGSQYEE